MSISSQTHALVSDPRPNARDRTVASRKINPGEIISRVEALSWSLVPQWIGKRCNYCLRRSSEYGGASDRKLRVCSKCKEVWYCGTNCQTKDWNESHSRLCKSLAKGLRTSAAYLQLSADEKADCELLLDLSLRYSQKAQVDNITDQGLDRDPLECFSDLLPHPHSRPLPPRPSSLRVTLKDSQLHNALKRHVTDDDDSSILEAAWLRFGPNNFVCHSFALRNDSAIPLDMPTSYAHGIFPLASRLFNHSCQPNAWAAYILGGDRVQMQVRALNEIPDGEEITIAYLDPALPFSERQDRLKGSYSFTCTCSKCNIERSLPEPQSPPAYPTSERQKLDHQLFEFVFPNNTFSGGVPSFSSIPDHLLSTRHESYLPSLSKEFEDASHDGPPERALQAGKALIAFYSLSYPSNYPLTAYALLALTKVCWNAHFTRSKLNDRQWIQILDVLLPHAERMFNVIGTEEEEEKSAALQELNQLRSLLDEELDGGI